MNLDESLLAKEEKKDESRNESAGKAGEFRQAGRDDNEDDEDDEDVSETSESSSLREAMALDKSKRKGRGPVDVSALKESAAAAPFSRGSSRMLQQSWLNLIPSWGTSLLWINIHVFLSQIFGKKYFCKLGDEWVDPAAAALGGSAKSADKKASLNNTGESAGLAACDGCCLFVVLIIAAIVVIVYKALSEPDTAVSLLGDGLWSFIQSIFQ